MSDVLELPPAVAKVFITDRLKSRPAAEPDYPREKLALQDLARRMADDPASLLPELVRLALQFCDGDSAGISVLEGDRFRWQDLTGRLASFEGAFTPRNSSPCGVCLDRSHPILMAHPEDAYDWIADADIVISEVLLVPLTVNGTQPLGTLWVVARDERPFDKGHARIMMELATFIGIALHMVQSDVRLKQALEQQETLAAEMSHRVKNVLATTNALVHMSMRGAATKEDMAYSLSGRLQALGAAHGMVRSSFASGREVRGVPLADLLTTIVRPYALPALGGPPIHLGGSTANALALIFHELTTNAAKYGALSVAGGAIRIAWKIDDDTLRLDWRETGGPMPVQPTPMGFGSRLVDGTIAGLDGTFARHWLPEGLCVEVSVPVARLAD
jgi:two-component sensor histidine kinase